MSDDQIIFSAMDLISLYSRQRDAIPQRYLADLDDCVERLKRDLVRVNDGSRPELILSVKMGTATIKGSLEFLLNRKNEND